MYKLCGTLYLILAIILFAISLALKYFYIGFDTQLLWITLIPLTLGIICYYLAFKNETPRP